MPPTEELHELDPVRGLPEYLPEGEEILWQGQPRWWSLCRRVFHIDLVVAYFVFLLIWRIVSPSEGQEVSLLMATLMTVLLCTLAVATFMVLARLICRTTIYTITNRRVAMQFGVALPLNLNLPFARVEAAGHRQYRDGTGDIPLQLATEERVAYLLLWPHARPWRVRRPEPMLRCLPDSEEAAGVLAQALENFHRVADGAQAVSDRGDRPPENKSTAGRRGEGLAV